MLFVVGGMQFIAIAQNIQPVIASSEGIGPFKIGITKQALEDSFKVKLLDTSKTENVDRGSNKGNDSGLLSPARYYNCTYQNIEFSLVFFKQRAIKNADFELVGVTTKSPTVRTKEGIRVSLTLDELRKISKRKSVYLHDVQSSGPSNTGYFISHPGDKESSQSLFVLLQHNVIVYIGVANFIGD